MKDALTLIIEVTDRAHEIKVADAQTLGFDVPVWLDAMRGQTLVMLGREEEARPFLDRILELKEDQVDAIHYVIPSLAYIDLAWSRNDARLAQEHSERAYSHAIKTGNPYLRVYGLAARGLANTVGKRSSSAVEDLTGALSFARSRRAGLENEPRILADLAYALSQKGDESLALSTVREAIEIATKRNSRIAECLARIVYGGLLIRSAQAEQEAQGLIELARARQLVGSTGAVILQPLLDAATASVDANGKSRIA
jgi:adenylate cyclase